jgi:hypothetical protein
MEIFLLFGCALLVDEKYAPEVHKPSSQPFRWTLNRPSNIKCIFCTFFGDRVVGKEDGLRTYGTFKTSAQELGVWRHFCRYRAARKFKLFFNI